MNGRNMFTWINCNVATVTCSEVWSLMWVPISRSIRTLLRMVSLFLFALSMSIDCRTKAFLSSGSCSVSAHWPRRRVHIWETVQAGWWWSVCYVFLRTHRRHSRYCLLLWWYWLNVAINSGSLASARGESELPSNYTTTTWCMFWKAFIFLKLEH